VQDGSLGESGFAGKFRVHVQRVQIATQTIEQSLFVGRRLLMLPVGPCAVGDCEPFTLRRSWPAKAPFAQREQGPFRLADKRPSGGRGACMVTVWLPWTIVRSSMPTSSISFWTGA
jgi:hypothetical protein